MATIARSRSCRLYSEFTGRLLLAGTASASLPQLNGTGSSFGGVAISQWQGQFNELDGGNVNFTVSYSYIGLQDFANDTVDFGASDLTYGASGITPPSMPYEYVPVVGGALGFEYNFTNTKGKQITSLVLDANTIAGIFTGQISDWDDPAIVRLNPTVKLPYERITPYYRSDPSGESYILSDYLLNGDPALVTAFQQLAGIPTPGQPSAFWASFAEGPPSNSQFPNLDNLVGVNGADAASQGPVHTQGGISYVETAYAKNVGLPVASVMNAAGQAKKPTSAHASIALEGATQNSDLSANLTGVFDDTAHDAYPVSAYSYFVVPCDPALAAAESPATTCSGDNTGVSTFPSGSGAELGQFIDFAVCLGQAKMAELGYVVLPKNLVEEAFSTIGSINGASKPPPPKPKNCPNPSLPGSSPG